jgi:cell shape-determining protein MreD
VTKARIAAAAASILTAVLLQATLIAPLCAPLPVSLPAVLVAAVAFMDGPATGMSFGFVAGLVADLGSRHPAGVLALCWLAVGLLCGTVADRHSLRHDAVTAGVVAGLAGGFAGVLLVIVRSGGTLRDVAVYTGPAIGVDVLLAIAVVAVVRRMLGSDALRAPHPVFTDLAMGSRRG